MLLFIFTNNLKLVRRLTMEKTNNLEEFMEELESDMWSQDKLSDDYQEGFAAAIEQIQEWVEKHKNTLEAPNGWEITFVETRRK